MYRSFFILLNTNIIAIEKEQIATKKNSSVPDDNNYYVNINKQYQLAVEEYDFYRAIEIALAARNRSIKHNNLNMTNLANCNIAILYIILQNYKEAEFFIQKIIDIKTLTENMYYSLIADKIYMRNYPDKAEQKRKEPSLEGGFFNYIYNKAAKLDYFLSLSFEESILFMQTALEKVDNDNDLN